MGLLANYILAQQQRNYQLEDRAARGAGAAGLLGQESLPYQGAVQPGQPELGYSPGSGLLGAGINDPRAQAVFSTGLMGLPGMGTAGAQSMNQVFNRGANLAWNRENLASQQDFTAGQNELTAQANLAEFDTEQFNAMERARMTREQSAANTAATIGGAMDRKLLEQQFKLENDPTFQPSTREGYKDNYQYQQAVRPVRNDYQKANAGNIQAINAMNGITNLVESKGGFESMTGADDIALGKAFLKTILPNEAVMSDDQKMLEAAAGYPGLIGSLRQAVSGSGSLDPSARQQIYQTMKTVADNKTQDYGRIRGDYSRLAERAGFDIEDVTTRDNPLELKALENVVIQESKIIKEKDAPKDITWGKPGTNRREGKN